MSNPEIKVQEIPPVQETQVDFQPTPTEHEQGIVSVPSQAQSTTVQVNNAQAVTVTPVPAPPSPGTITIPQDPIALKKKSQGDITNSSTWLGFFWLRMIQKAIKQGLQVLVGGGNSAQP